MVRPSILVDPYKGYIQELREDNMSNPEICEILKRDFDIEISESTLRRRLAH